MSRRIFILIVVCILFSIGSVTLLVFMSNVLKDKRNSFLREFPPHPALEGDSLRLGYNSYYIAGGTPHTIYLGNSTAPLHLLEVNLASLDTHRITLRVKGFSEKKFWAPRLQVDSPHYYLTDGAVPIIYKGNVDGWYAERYLTDSVYFRNFVPISDRSFLLKSLDGETHENMIGKLTDWSPHPFFKRDILEKQLDGVFCTDGMMHYDKRSNRLVYLYYYRNEFIVLDSTLTVLYRGHTIDTTSRAKIKPASMNNGSNKTLASPPFLVNCGSDITEDWLFVHSGLLAWNESEDAFALGSTIDVYRLSDGKYRFSFHIYHYGGTKKMIQFRVFKDKVIVLYDSIIRIYSLMDPYFNSSLQAVL